MKFLRLGFAKTLAVIMAVCVGGFVFLGWIKYRDGPAIDDRPFNEVLAPQLAQRGAYLVPRVRHQIQFSPVFDPSTLTKSST